jgi:ABC-type glycerol-3-phosphate transport system permease component
MKLVLTFFTAILLITALIMMADQNVINRLYALIICCVIMPSTAIVINRQFSKAQEKYEKLRRERI